MAYSKLTTVTDWKDLLDEVYTFAVADGWAGVYNESGRTTGDKSQIGIAAGSCLACLGENPSDGNVFTHTDFVNGGTVDDANIYGSINTGVSGAITKYWGQSGSIVTTAADVDAVKINDLAGPFPNVWMFGHYYSTTSRRHIWVIVETAANRFCHFGFGHVDTLGQTHDNVDFMVGNFYTWWPNQADYSNDSGYGPNNPEYTGHNLGHSFYKTNTNACAMFRIVDGTTLPSGFPAAGVYNGDYATPVMYPRGSEEGDAGTTNIGGILNFLSPIGNMPTTGGTPLHGIPVLFRKDNTSDPIEHCFLGILPEVRMIDCDDVPPGGEVTFGSDVWVVFPWIQKGEWVNMNTGTSPTWHPNTGHYGIAYKKNV